jgi:hypothetical protein
MQMVEIEHNGLSYPAVRSMSIGMKTASRVREASALVKNGR